MIGWHGFELEAPEVANAGVKLLGKNEVAFLATVSGTGRPRIHPFVPKVVDGRLVAFIMDSAPRIDDLRLRKQYSIHALPGSEDEEFFISGEAECRDGKAGLRNAAAVAMAFATGVDEHHILYEFLIDRALWTRWIDFGTPHHRPLRIRWRHQDQ